MAKRQRSELKVPLVVLLTMDWLRNIVKRSKPQPEDFREALERQDWEKQAAKAWEASGEAEEWSKQILSAWRLKRSGLDSRLMIHLHESPVSNGLFFQPPEEWDVKAQHWLLDRLCARVQALDYKLSFTEKHHEFLDSGLRLTEVYYLKPRVEGDAPWNQRYGNIHLEYRKLGDRGLWLKIMANQYHDRSYSPALSFDEFIPLLFG